MSQQIIAQGYDIKIRVKGLSDTTVILGYHNAGSLQAFDTTWINEKGIGRFKGDKQIPGGIYFLYLPSQKTQDLLIDDNQNFQIITDTSLSLSNTVYKNSIVNARFIDYQKNFLAYRNKDAELAKKLKDSTNAEPKESIKRQMNENRKAYEKFISKTITDNQNNFLGYLIKSIQDIEIPEIPGDTTINPVNSNWQYYYYRNHYFSNFDLTDARLFRTPFYQDKVMTYITKVCEQNPDSLMVQADYLIDKVKNDSTLFRYMLITLFSHFARSNIMGMDAVTIHIAEKYYLTDSWWSSPKTLADIKESVKKTKSLLIGKTAPDMELMHVPSQHFIDAAKDTTLKRYPHAGTMIDLNMIDAKYLVLLFWEADCGHCKKAVPEMYKLYEQSLKSLNVKILAISTLFGEEGKIEWIDFVNKNKMYDWINAWNPYSYQYKIKYDIETTPQIFILDENKKIIAKKISPEQVVEIIKALNGE